MSSVVFMAYPCSAHGIDQMRTEPNIFTSNILPSEEIAQIASRCRQEILKTHHLKPQVHAQNMREYAITLGLASDKCEAIIKTLAALQQATLDYQDYQKNLQHAQLSAAASDTNLSEHTYMSPENSHNSFAPEPFDAQTTEPNDFVTPDNGHITEENLSSHAEPSTLN